MRRRSTGHMALAVLALLLPVAVAAQQGTINPRIPPPPPQPEDPPAPVGVPPPLPTPPPETVAIAAGTRVPVVLDTPLSTRITKTGQRVSFRTVDPLSVHETLEIPPETEFVGTVAEARRPGAFGRAGKLRVRVDHIQLSNGTPVNVAARLDSPDGRAGRFSADSKAKSNVADLAQWALLGTLTGWQIGGGKGAGYGAAAGATVALVIGMSQRGPDLYLEPGMPFTVVLDQPATLPGTDVLAAQQAYARTHASTARPSSAAGPASDPDPDDRAQQSQRPKLKRRPRTVPSQP